MTNCPRSIPDCPLETFLQLLILVQHRQPPIYFTPLATAKKTGAISTVAGLEKSTLPGLKITEYNIF